MHINIFVPFLFLFVIFNGCQAKELKICVKYEKTVAMRETQINLTAIRVNSKNEYRNIKENIKIGECFDISIPQQENNKTKKITFQFTIYVKPLENEYQPPADDHDENPSDEGPYENRILDIKMDDIRTMVRRNNFVIHEPNPSMVYTFNLGKIDPPGFLWKRKIFVLPENDLSNYHAFLYAVAYRNQRIQDNLNSKICTKLLGYAPFVKIDKEIAPTFETDDKRVELNNEYQLTIPIDASNLFKHYIFGFNLVIYSYEKNNNYDETLDTKNAIQANECSICLETFNSEKETMKLHDDYQHIFHNDCIIKWVKQQQLLRCPLCNREAKFIKNAQVKVSVGVSNEISPPFFYIDPLAHLFQLANGQTLDDCQFKINQAKLLLKQFTDHILASGEEQLKRMVSEADFLNIKLTSGQKLFEIGPDGLHEDQTVNQIQKELENVLYSKENVSAITIKNTVTMFEIIGKIRNLNVSAQSFLDGMQHITMEANEEF